QFQSQPFAFAVVDRGPSLQIHNGHIAGFPDGDLQSQGTPCVQVIFGGWELPPKYTPSDQHWVRRSLCRPLAGTGDEAPVATNKPPVPLHPASRGRKIKLRVLSPETCAFLPVSKL